MALRLLLPAALWLGLFVAMPCLILVAIALAHSADAVPPFALGWDTAKFVAAITDPLYRDGFFASLRVGLVSASLCTLIGYPMALAIARSRHRTALLFLVVLPLWSGFLMRLMAWIGILRDEGWLNTVLLSAGLIDSPLVLLHTDGAMYVGMVTTYLPFFILPLQARLAAADPALEEAAADLGATPWRIFRRVTLPLSLPGAAAGFLFVFIPVTGEVVIPSLLGAPDSLTMGRVIWDTFFQENDWPQAAALAVVLLLALLVPTLALRRT